MDSGEDSQVDIDERVLGYHEDIKPILDAHCGSCHDPGGIAPFALTTYAEVLPMSDAIEQAVKTRSMPPWGAEPGHRPLRYDPSLRDEQIDRITAWVAQGSPEGNPDNPGEPFVLDLGDLDRVDVEIEMKSAYAPQNSPDEYRCFVVDWPETETTYITGYVGVPGTRAIVHHLVIFMVGPNQADRVGDFEDLEPEAPGYPCFGGLTPTLEEEPYTGPAINAQLIGQWAPGLAGQEYAPGTGIRVAPGSKAVLQVHYNIQAAGSMDDQSKIGFRIDSEVEREGAVVAFLNGHWFLDPTSMLIPAGEANVEHSFRAPLREALYNPIIAPRAEIHSLLPHMHKLGRQIRLSKQRGDGSEVLLNLPDYDFNWQRDYVFETPVLFEPEDELLLECTWNNTKQWRARVGAKPVEPIDVGWGEGTVDEMCVAALYVTAAK